MKRLIFIALALTLALGIILVPSVAAVEPVAITIHKTVPDGCPVETFTFELWRDINNNGVLDFDDPVWGPDILVGSVDITGNGTGVIFSTVMGRSIVHEALDTGSAYEQQPDQVVQVYCAWDVYFENKCREKGRLVINKVDEEGGPLAGACFNITPDPRTCEGSLELCDNDLNDECSANGTLCLSGLMVGCPFTVTETKAPDGYDLDPTAYSGNVTVPGEIVTVSIVNIKPKGELTIIKQDGSGNALAGATFEICPNPKTGTLPCLTVVDEGLNDEATGEPGVLSVGECIIGLNCTVTETVAPAGYDPAPAQNVTISGVVSLTFVNERCRLIIHKVDAAGNALSGACFNITPNPKTGTGILTLCDNDANDECSANGTLCLGGLICGLKCTVAETVAPTGYNPAPAQTVTISDTVTLTFVNTPKTKSCGTVCAAQAAPGQYLFDARQQNWFTWIYYKMDWGSEASPKTYPIYTGKNITAGTLYVYDKLVSAGVTHLFVRYVLNDTATCELAGLSVYHLQVDSTAAALKSVIYKNKNAVPGNAEYSGTFDPMVPATGWIESTLDNVTGWTTAYIFAHGVGCYYCP